MRVIIKPSPATVLDYFFNKLLICLWEISHASCYSNNPRADVFPQVLSLGRRNKHSLFLTYLHTHSLLSDSSKYIGVIWRMEIFDLTIAVSSSYKNSPRGTLQCNPNGLVTQLKLCKDSHLVCKLASYLGEFCKVRGGNQFILFWHSNGNEMHKFLTEGFIAALKHL